MNQADLHVPQSALNGIVSVGNFDGVHRGHQQMLKTLREIAAEHSAPAIVVTFDPHPLSLLRPDAPLPRLTTIERRTALLREYGADQVVVLPVTKQLLQMTADDFFHQVLVEQLSAAGIVEGPNFRFGRDRSGDVDRLADLCQSKNIAFRVIQPVDDEGQMISSSRIRTLLSEGRLCDAVAMTGHAHRISGVVSHGAGRGRQLGFPTANLENIRVMLPTNGVYAGTANIAGRQYVAAVSIGPNPTFDDNRLKVECYVDGFTGDLYETELNIDLLSKIRSLCSFTSVEELTQQITTDVKQCRVQIARLEQPIYKICTTAEWQTAVAAGELIGSEVDIEDGFIHFSTAGQLKETAAKHFCGQTDLMLVEVDPIRLGSALKWEPSRKGDLFPHLYAPLPVDAAPKAAPLPWHNDSHQFPN
jgi:riboflavin kinase/FMN adenylyltransferase